MQLPESATLTERQLITLAKCCNANTKHFWSLWKSHYLQLLREKGFRRNEAFPRRTTNVTPVPNSIVLIAEKNIKRKNWKLGRIVETITSNDGVIRSAKIDTKHCILIRPLNELYPLEIDDNLRTTDQTLSPDRSSQGGNVSSATSILRSNSTSDMSPGTS